MSLAVASAIINHFLKSSFTGFPRALDFQPFPEPPATLAHASPTHHKLPRETKENGPVKTGCCASFGLVYLIVSGLEGYFSFNIMYYQFCLVRKMANCSPVPFLPFFQFLVLQSCRIGTRAVNRIFPWAYKYLCQTHIKHNSSPESALGITNCPRIFKMNVHFMVQIGPNLS